MGIYWRRASATFPSKEIKVYLWFLREALIDFYSSDREGSREKTLDAKLALIFLFFLNSFSFPRVIFLPAAHFTRSGQVVERRPALFVLI